MTKFTEDQINEAARLLNSHYRHCDDHYDETLDEIGGHGVLTEAQLQELIDHPEVQAKVRY
jgi:hypothetical protein